MPADFLHPVIRDVFDLHFPGLRTTALSPDGEEVEVRCEKCMDTGRAYRSDAPCECPAGDAGRTP
jgi:hypothetical protein